METYVTRIGDVTIERVVPRDKAEGGPRADEVQSVASPAPLLPPSHLHQQQQQQQHPHHQQRPPLLHPSTSDEEDEEEEEIRGGEDYEDEDEEGYDEDKMEDEGGEVAGPQPQQPPPPPPPPMPVSSAEAEMEVGAEEVGGGTPGEGPPVDVGQILTAVHQAVEDTEMKEHKDVDELEEEEEEDGLEDLDAATAEPVSVMESEDLLRDIKSEPLDAPLEEEEDMMRAGDEEELEEEDMMEEEEEEEDLEGHQGDDEAEEEKTATAVIKKEPKDGDEEEEVPEGDTGEESFKRKAGGESDQDSDEKTNKKKKGEEGEGEGDKSLSERKATNLRKNIREVMDETQLDEATLSAQRQEMERLKRVQDQQKYIREVQRQIAINRQNNKTQTRVISLLQGNTISKSGVAGSSKPSTVLVKLSSNGGPPQVVNKKVLEVFKSGKSTGTTTDSKPGIVRIPNKPHMVTPSVSIAPVKPSTPTEPPKTKDVVTISSSSDEDDCIVISEPSDEEMEEEEDPNNSGMHTNDLYNTADEQGRVLINVGKPENDPDVFLAPQIARVIKPHQIGGVRFMFDNVVESLERFNTSPGFGCILAHSMGLGKTLQVVSFCDVFLSETSGKTVMCIMPINTLQNWMAEFNMWLPTDPSSSPLSLTGEVRPRNFGLFVLNDLHKTISARARVVQEWKKDGGVLLIGYEMYRQLSLKRSARTRKGKKKIPEEDMDDEKNKPLLDEMHEALVKPGPDLVICDEGHRIKNSHASISHALKQIRTRRRIVLTGYPLQNNLQEYWCMVDFVRPNYLGSKTEFSNMFERPIQNGQCIDSTPKDIRLMRYRAHVLHSLLEGFVQRRSHAVLRNTLPQKEEYVLLVRMTSFQRKLYDTFMNEVVRTKAVPNPLKAFAVCCKIWNHPDILYNFLKKREMDELQDLDLEEAAALAPGTNPAGVDPKRAKEKKGKGNTKKAQAVATPIKNPAVATVPPNTSQSVDSKQEPGAVQESQGQFGQNFNQNYPYQQYNNNYGQSYNNQGGSDFGNSYNQNYGGNFYNQYSGYYPSDGNTSYNWNQQYNYGNYYPGFSGDTATSGGGFFGQEGSGSNSTSTGGDFKPPKTEAGEFSGGDFATQKFQPPNQQQQMTNNWNYGAQNPGGFSGKQPAGKAGEVPELKYSPNQNKSPKDGFQEQQHYSQGSSQTNLGGGVGFQGKDNKLANYPGEDFQGQQKPPQDQGGFSGGFPGSYHPDRFPGGQCFPSGTQEQLSNTGGHFKESSPVKQMEVSSKDNSPQKPNSKFSDQHLDPMQFGIDSSKGDFNINYNSSGSQVNYNSFPQNKHSQQLFSQPTGGGGPFRKMAAQASGERNDRQNETRSNYYSNQEQTANKFGNQSCSGGDNKQQSPQFGGPATSGSTPFGGQNQTSGTQQFGNQQPSNQLDCDVGQNKNSDKSFQTYQQDQFQFSGAGKYSKPSGQQASGSQFGIQNICGDQEGASSFQQKGLPQFNTKENASTNISQGDFNEPQFRGEPRMFPGQNEASRAFPTYGNQGGQSPAGKKNTLTHFSGQAGDKSNYFGSPPGTPSFQSQQQFQPPGQFGSTGNHTGTQTGQFQNQKSPSEFSGQYQGNKFGNQNVSNQFGPQNEQLTNVSGGQFEGQTANQQKNNSGPANQRAGNQSTQLAAGHFTNQQPGTGHFSNQFTGQGQFPHQQNQFTSPSSNQQAGNQYSNSNLAPNQQGGSQFPGPNPPANQYSGSNFSQNQPSNQFSDSKQQVNQNNQQDIQFPSAGTQQGNNQYSTPNLQLNRQAGSCQQYPVPSPSGSQQGTTPFSGSNLQGGNQFSGSHHPVNQQGGNQFPGPNLSANQQASNQFSNSNLPGNQLAGHNQQGSSQLAGHNQHGGNQLAGHNQQGGNQFPNPNLSGNQQGGNQFSNSNIPANQQGTGQFSNPNLSGSQQGGNHQFSSHNLPTNHQGSGPFSSSNLQGSTSFSSANQQGNGQFSGSSIQVHQQAGNQFLNAGQQVGNQFASTNMQSNQQGTSHFPNSNQANNSLSGANQQGNNQFPSVNQQGNNQFSGVNQQGNNQFTGVNQQANNQFPSTSQQGNMYPSSNQQGNIPFPNNVHSGNGQFSSSVPQGNNNLFPNSNQQGNSMYQHGTYSNNNQQGGTQLSGPNRSGFSSGTQQGGNGPYQNNNQQQMTSSYSQAGGSNQPSNNPFSAGSGNSSSHFANSQGSQFSGGHTPANQQSSQFTGGLAPSSQQSGQFGQGGSTSSSQQAGQFGQEGSSSSGQQNGQFGQGGSNSSNQQGTQFSGGSATSNHQFSNIIGQQGTTHSGAPNQQTAQFSTGSASLNQQSGQFSSGSSGIFSSVSSQQTGQISTPSTSSNQQSGPYSNSVGQQQSGQFPGGTPSANQFPASQQSSQFSAGATSSGQFSGGSSSNQFPSTQQSGQFSSGQSTSNQQTMSYPNALGQQGSQFSGGASSSGQFSSGPTSSNQQSAQFPNPLGQQSGQFSNCPSSSSQFSTNQPSGQFASGSASSNQQSGAFSNQSSGQFSSMGSQYSGQPNSDMAGGSHFPQGQYFTSGNQSGNEFRFPGHSSGQLPASGNQFGTLQQAGYQQGGQQSQQFNAGNYGDQQKSGQNNQFSCQGLMGEQGQFQEHQSSVGKPASNSSYDGQLTNKLNSGGAMFGKSGGCGNDFSEKQGTSCQTDPIGQPGEAPANKSGDGLGEKDEGAKDGGEQLVRKEGELSAVNDPKKSIDFVATSAIASVQKSLKEDPGIPYDWAIELLKGYVPGKIEASAKMSVFFCILEESIALGDRILVFSQSLFTLNLMEELLQQQLVPGKEEKWLRNINYYRLDGSTSALEREKLINEFNSNPNLHLFLVSTRAGSLGINLVGANRVIVFDASWNPCHDTQAVCRVYRYGQKKPCFVYRLVTDNCLEKKIYDRQINKQGMADRVVDECNPEAHLSIKEVTSLCWDDQEDNTPKDFTDLQHKYIDVVIQKVLQKHSSFLSKEPFHHESLLVDRKDKKLSQAEKRLAKRSYELEKQANSNNARPLYNHYPNNIGTQVGVQMRGMRQDKPMASVRPMQSEIGSQLVRDGRQQRGWIPASVWQRQGMSAQEMTLPLDVVIPTNSPDRASIVLKAGQKVMVLKSPKGIYMQLENGKIIAIRTAFKVGQKDKKGMDKPEPKKDPAPRMRHPLPNLRNSSISIIPRSSMSGPRGPTNSKPVRLLGPKPSDLKGKQPMAAARPYIREPPVTVTVTKKRVPEPSTSELKVSPAPPPPPQTQVQIQPKPRPTESSDSSDIETFTSTVVPVDDNREQQTAQQQQQQQRFPQMMEVPETSSVASGADSAPKPPQVESLAGDIVPDMGAPRSELDIGLSRSELSIQRVTPSKPGRSGLPQESSVKLTDYQGMEGQQEPMQQVSTLPPPVEPLQVPVAVQKAPEGPKTPPLSQPQMMTDSIYPQVEPSPVQQSKSQEHPASRQETAEQPFDLFKKHEAFQQRTQSIYEPYKKPEAKSPRSPRKADDCSRSPRSGESFRVAPKTPPSAEKGFQVSTRDDMTKSEGILTRPEPYQPATPLPNLGHAVSIFPVGKSTAQFDYGYPPRPEYYPAYPPAYAGYKPPDLSLQYPPAMYPPAPPPGGEGYTHQPNPFSAAAAASRVPPAASFEPDYSRYSAFHRPEAGSAPPGAPTGAPPPPPTAYAPYAPYSPFLMTPPPPQYLPPNPPPPSNPPQ